MIDKALVSIRFGRAAPRYALHARVQEHAANALLEAIRVRAPGLRAQGGRPLRALRILELGSGTGLLTRRLLDLFPGANLLGVDIAPGMVAEATRRLGARGAHFLVADLDRTFPAGPFDLIASSMALQWLDDPASCLARASQRLSPSGLFAMVAPVQGTLPELQDSYRRAAQALRLRAWRYPGLAFHPAEAWAGWARAAFDRVESALEVVTERHGDVRSLLRSIRGVGANGGSSGPSPGGLALLRAALDGYDRDHRVGDGVVATWRLGTLVAERRAGCVELAGA
jgi:malonyl-CoA O-methyltransferase